MHVMWTSVQLKCTFRSLITSLSIFARHSDIPLWDKLTTKTIKLSTVRTTLIQCKMYT